MNGWRVVTEQEFAKRLALVLSDVRFLGAGWVTGPGRSGAVAAVYASHVLRIPFVPYGNDAPGLGAVLVIDTARESGATMRKAMRRYQHRNPIECVLFEEPPRVMFWYEAGKPQRYRHETLIAAVRLERPTRNAPITASMEAASS